MPDPNLMILRTTRTLGLRKPKPVKPTRAKPQPLRLPRKK